MSDYPEPDDLTVFSTFACGGGSTMGYKLAGYNVLGCLEIDPELVQLYEKNHDPELSYCEDIRDFRQRKDLPDALYDLDVLDGSPPCSTFSTAGNRDDDWGKEKEFREGQAVQRLDDLFGEFIRLVDRLQPKVAISENVTGMLQGKAKGYVKEIARGFDEIGYDLQIFKLNAGSMGVPQMRRRVFPIARRKNLGWSDLTLQFNEEPIPFGEVRQDQAEGYSQISEFDQWMWNERLPSEASFGDVGERVRGKPASFNTKFIDDHRVCNTIASATGSKLICGAESRYLSVDELRMCSTFPMDYRFLGVRPKYVMGMSVPPVMMAQIATEIREQWFS
jgi:DNA (cytosine-5)-methyltransferase 1